MFLQAIIDGGQHGIVAMSARDKDASGMDEFRKNAVGVIGFILLVASSVTGTRMIMGQAICNTGYDFVVFGTLMSTGLFVASVLRSGRASTNATVFLGVAALVLLIATGAGTHPDECLPNIEEMGRSPGLFAGR